MGEWIRAGLDIILILVVGAGLVHAVRLLQALAGLRQSRVEMEQFVRDFNATVMRAENGIKGLRMAARESGDDLEKLVQKAGLLRDELHFIVESGDALAERLTQSAARAQRADTRAESRVSQNYAPPSPAPQPNQGVKTENAETKPQVQPAPPAPVAATPVAKEPSSRAEKELLQALQKLN